MARRRVSQVEPQTDALDEVMQDDIAGTATEVSAVLDELRSVLTDESQILIYKMPPRGGPWEYIKTLTPPINADNILEEIKEEWGGGQYMFRVRANGRIVSGKRASIAGAPKVPGTGNPTDKSNELLPLMLNTQQKSSSDMMTMMMTMMQQQSAASDRQMQLMMQSGQQQMQMLVAMLPVIAGGKTDPVQMMQAFAALNADKGGGMRDTLEMLVTAKSLFGAGDGEGGGSDDMFTTALKTFGPGVVKMVENMTNNPNSGGMPIPRALPNPIQSGVKPEPYRPPPHLQQYRPPVTPPPMPGLDTPAVPAAPSNPVLALIAKDVLFFANGDYDAALAAEAVLAKIDKAGIGEHDLMALVIRFQSSDDWIADVAAEGLDLRHKREWAQEFISELVAQYTENNTQDDDTGGDGGSESDTV